MRQLELGFWPRGCVRQVLLDYLDMRWPAIVEETQIDYTCRLEWLCEVLGPSTLADTVTFVVLERVAREARQELADRTIRMRFQFWAAAVEYATQREIVLRGRPTLPPWLSGATKKMDDFYTLSQYAQFRLGLPPNEVRAFADLGFWTGMHTKDLEQTERWMLQPDHVWEGTDRRGRFWRRNTKSSKRIDPTWVPMEPELRELALGWLSKRGDRTARICGVVNNKRKFYTLAAERAELPNIRPNLGLRASHSTLLLARGYSYEYVRLVLGHRGEIRGVDRPDAPGPDGGPRPARAVTTRPSVLSGHYLRPSPDTLRPQG
jgi:integrase